MTTKTYYTTYDFIRDLFEDVDRAFNSLGHGNVYPNSFPPCNIYVNEENKDLVMEFAVAGIPKDKISLAVDGDNLLLEIEKVDRELKGFRLAQQGIKGAEIKRKFYVPASKYSMDKIKTSLRDGILRIDIPAKAEMQKRKLLIG